MNKESWCYNLVKCGQYLNMEPNWRCSTEGKGQREIRWAGPMSLFNCGTWFRTGAFTNKRLLQYPHGASATCSKGVPPSQAQNNWWAVILFTQETWFWMAVYKSDFCADNQIWSALGNLASWTQHSSEYFVKWLMKTLPLALTSPVFMRLTAACECASVYVHVGLCMLTWRCCSDFKLAGHVEMTKTHIRKGKLGGLRKDRKNILPLDISGHIQKVSEKHIGSET